MEDVRFIAEIHVRTWQAAYRGQLRDDYLDGLTATLPGRIHIWTRAIGAPPSSRHHVLVAERDGVMVGFVSFGPSEDEDAPAGCGQVYAIYVDPSAWGAGAGRALFAEAAAGLRADGFATATLWVLATNARARRFYEIAGWRTDGAIKIEQRGNVDLREVRYHGSLD